MEKHKNDTATEQADFSLVQGGPLYHIFLHTGLAQPSTALLPWPIIAVALITWLPLALFTILGGSFLGGIDVPFLYDIDVQVRFLIALPLLIGAELSVNSRLRVVVAQFTQCELIAAEDRRSFEDIISWAMRLRNSITIEILLLVVAFAASYWVWRSQASLGVASWYAAITTDAISLTWAGYWYVFVSMSIFRFILLRWYFRIFIWYLFLFRVSRLRLQLVALHPDRAGGLEFLSSSVYAMSPVLIAQSVSLAGLIADQIFYAGATLADFKILIGSVVAFLILLMLLPLGFFTPQMAAARRAALREYGAFAARYDREFRQKWRSVSQTRDKELLGSADIQSLADLAGGYEVAHEMKLQPFGGYVVVRLVILIALPLLPLVLTMFSFEVILQQVLRLLI